MINAINLRTLKNSDFLQYHVDVRTIVALNLPQALKVTDQFDAYDIQIRGAEDIFKKETSSLLSKELATIDDERDGLFNGIRLMVVAGLHHPLESVQAHAFVMDAHIASYGKAIVRENYHSETIILSNMLSDWNTKPALQAAVTALNLTPWITRLEETNKAFHAKYVERTQEAGAAPTGSFKQKRDDVLAAYYDLRDNINSYFVISKGEGVHAKVTNELNALIDKYNLLTRRGKGPETPSTPANPQPTKP
jgi:hypothetical protein